MKKPLHYSMIILLIFLCGSGMAVSRTESLLHECCGIFLFLCILLHLVKNRQWFAHLFQGKYNAYRTVITIIDLLIIVMILLIAISSVTISGYVFSPIALGGAAWGRKIHFAATAWLLVLSGFHCGLHMKTEKRNVLLYIAGAGGIIAFIICRLYERLLLLNEFAYMPALPSWTIYLLHAIMFAAFIALGSECRRRIKNNSDLPRNDLL